MMYQDSPIAVLCGGTSKEREISLLSGRAVYDSLHAQGYDVIKLDTQDTSFLEPLKAAKVQRAFIALHGPGGEDGEVARVLAQHDISATGNCAQSSALAMDKMATKRIWQQAQCCTPKACYVHDYTLEQLSQEIGFPMVIKPTLEGSSFGVKMVHAFEDLASAIQSVQAYGPLMAEAFVAGRELTIGWVGDHLLPMIEITTPEGFYDYQAKYQSNSTSYLFPKDIAPSIEKQCYTLAQKAYQSVGCSGWGRVDFILDQQNCPYLLEVNTIPGMTQKSLVPKAAQAYGWSFDTLVSHILEALRCY